jgi:hypothetical protein
MQPLLVIQKLSATNSRIEKENIIQDAFMNDCFDFFIGAKLATDQLVSFGVKKVAEILEDDNSDGDYTFQNFLDLAKKLQKRELTGYAARDAIHDAALRCHVPTWNQFYRRILLKDLNIGVDEKTINKVLKKLIKIKPEAEKYLIPVFTCQLAHDGEDDVHKKKIKGKKLIDIKLDGCLNGEWIIEFEDGRKLKISDVVDNKIEGKIKSYDILNNKIVYRNIKNWAFDGNDSNEKNYEWYIITLENGLILPPLTGNHLVFLPELNCWRRVDQLKLTDKLLSDTVF